MSSQDKNVLESSTAAPKIEIDPGSCAWMIHVPHNENKSNFEKYIRANSFYNPTKNRLHLREEKVDPKPFVAILQS
jgi:hypothetical protein